MPDHCPTCDRPVQEKHHKTRTHRPIVSVSYRHEGYGCDTGCCGHVLFALDDRGGVVSVGDFNFMHEKDELDQRLAALSDHLSVPIDPPPEFVED
jgi:hypothetical protein